MAFSLSQPMVGLVIREQAVEVVQLSRGLGGAKLVECVRVPIGGAQAPAEGGAPVGAAVPDATRVAEAIQNALHAAKVKTKRVMVAIPPHEVEIDQPLESRNE